MKLLLWIGLCLGALLAHAQKLQVTESLTGLPLANVKISYGQNLLFTDSKGQATLKYDLSADTLMMSKSGFEIVRISWSDLESINFIVRLEKSTIMMKELMVSSDQLNETGETSIHVEHVTPEKMAAQGAFSLTDALAKVPGVSQLSTGIGISKPVIRGLYGNRVLVLLSGLRFDNQQWQDEHGLGLSEVGISKVEIIKGAMSLLYGTEAVGGVINIIEELHPTKGTTEGDAQMIMHSNTLGGTVQAGIKSNHDKYWYRFRLSASNHADYSDGNQMRVLNSRFNNYLLKSSFGFKRDHWTSENHYQFSQSQFGFVFNDSGQFFEPDNRWSRKMAGPHHSVLLNMFSSLNRFRLSNSTLDANVGLQSNLRSEDEGGGELSLKIHLLTGQYNLKWNKTLGEHLSLAISNFSLFEHNQNLGRRKIVPNANTAETNLSVYLHHHWKHFIWEYGVGAGGRFIQTQLTPTVNSFEKDIDPFSQFRPYSNAMIGGVYSPDSHWRLKCNLSTGVRSPNLAELSANGLHEGIYTYELGDPDLKNEHNQNVDIGIHYQSDLINLSISGFYNHFKNYIYLTPTADNWFGFPVYRFTKGDALLYGGEVVMGITPRGIKGLKLEGAYSGVIGQLNSGVYLPYMPAQKVRPEIRYDRDQCQSWKAFAFVNADFVFAQSRINAAEKMTPTYHLINLGIGFTKTTEKAGYSLCLGGNNILNEAYFDHLSRFKNLGLLNVGRDISIQLKINFIQTNKNK